MISRFPISAQTTVSLSDLTALNHVTTILLAYTIVMLFSDHALTPVHVKFGAQTVVKIVPRRFVSASSLKMTMSISSVRNGFKPNFETEDV